MVFHIITQVRLTERDTTSDAPSETCIATKFGPDAFYTNIEEKKIFLIWRLESSSLHVYVEVDGNVGLHAQMVAFA